MGFIDAVKSAYSKYADFEGTATRSEFWWFYLYCTIVWILSIITLFIQPIISILFFIISIANIIPYIGVAIRRLHDLNYSGWRILWGFIPFFGTVLLIVWYSTKGKQSQLNGTEFNTTDFTHEQINRESTGRAKPKNDDSTSGKIKFR